MLDECTTKAGTVDIIALLFSIAAFCCKYSLKSNKASLLSLNMKQLTFFPSSTDEHFLCERSIGTFSKGAHFA